MSEKISVELPDTASDLIETAVNDALGLDPNDYNLRSDFWWYRDENGDFGGKCQVCLAAAVVLSVLEEVGDFREMVRVGGGFIDAFDYETGLKLSFLNTVRCGQYRAAFKAYGGFTGFSQDKIEKKLAAFLGMTEITFPRANFDGLDEFKLLAGDLLNESKTLRMVGL